MFDHPGGILQETRRDEIRDEIHEALGIEISKDDDEEDEDEEGEGAIFTHPSMVCTMLHTELRTFWWVECAVRAYSTLPLLSRPSFPPAAFWNCR